VTITIIKLENIYGSQFVRILNTVHPLLDLKSCTLVVLARSVSK
jgi:hypothetical protein